MPRIDAATAGGRNALAFLDMLPVSELGRLAMANSDDGYNVIVGGSQAKPTLFTNYQDHPRIKVTLLDKSGKPKIDPRTGKPLLSTAAGRYQILSWIYDGYRLQLRLPDFSPRSQDLIALRLIRECGAMQDIAAGRISAAITKCASRWASLPGAGYGQHENALDVLIDAYKRAGGVITA
ncbi:glycoside hydrolase family 104 protein [Pandoraea sp. SD6-2]|uniref:glycoside hydrolase family 24 protein n=1 Tax=Pandoraea sp. SD6-2 TaxID=1286093 RepID=UPI00032DD04D|nr:glycoside hydrolase family 104 protein [Pandoraea sp. SD6-2]EON10617.1 bacteriophage endolysin protein [Pandoraea sp. SD6-2]